MDADRRRSTPFVVRELRRRYEHARPSRSLLCLRRVRGRAGRRTIRRLGVLLESADPRSADRDRARGAVLLSPWIAWVRSAITLTCELRTAFTAFPRCRSKRTRAGF